MPLILHMILHMKDCTKAHMRVMITLRFALEISHESRHIIIIMHDVTCIVHAIARLEED